MELVIQALLALLGLVAVAEVLASLTPTKKDDLAVERIGHYIKKVLKFLNVPNHKHGGGNHGVCKEESSSEKGPKKKG